MATFVEVEGLAEFRRAVKAAGNGLDKTLNRELRRALGPIVADARARFNALPGTGPRTAKQVRGSVTQSGIAVTLTGRAGFEFGREFGAKGGKLLHYRMRGGGWASGWSGEVTRFHPYDRPSVFGPWTGNRFTLWSATPPGNAFFPAVSDGGSAAVDRVVAAIDATVERMAT